MDGFEDGTLINHLFSLFECVPFANPSKMLFGNDYLLFLGNFKPLLLGILSPLITVGLPFREEGGDRHGNIP